MFGWFVPVVSIQVFSVEVYIVRCTWLKERKLFTQNIFLVHAQTILKVNDIFVQFPFLSSYRKGLYRNDFVSQWPVSVQFALRNSPTALIPRMHRLTWDCYSWELFMKVSSPNFFWGRETSAHRLFMNGRIPFLNCLRQYNIVDSIRRTPL